MARAMKSIPAGRLSDEQRLWLADLYETHFAAVFRACLSVLKSRDDAADASHEVFLSAVDSMRHEATGKLARAWLVTVARNHCLDVLRRRKRLSRALVTLQGGAGESVNLEAAVADRDFVDALIRQLPLRERQALWQSAVEHRSLSDIAHGLQLSYMAAAQVLHRAKQHASRMAARVAVVFGLLGLGRAARRMSTRGARLLSLVSQPAGQMSAGTCARLLAVAVVPLLMVSIQSSTSTGAPGPAPIARASVTAPAAQGLVLPGLASGGAGRLGTPGAVAGPPIALPVQGRSAADALVNIVNHSIGQLFGTGIETPGLPAAPVVPATLPPVPTAPPLGH